MSILKRPGYGSCVLAVTPNMGDNSHTMKTRYLNIGLMVTSALALALPASAATPQETLNQILAMEQAKGPQKVDMTMEINAGEKPFKITSNRSDVQARLHLNLRGLPDAGAGKSGEGRVSLDKLSSTMKIYKQPAETQSYDTPLAVQWKYADKVAYFRLESVAPAILDELKKGGIDPSKYVGQWYMLDFSQLADTLKNDNNSSASILGLLGKTAKPFQAVTQVQSNDLAAWKGKSILLVTSVQKTWTDAKGQKMLRLVVRVNPAFVNAMYRAEIKKISAKDPQRRDKIVAVSKKFQDMRQSLTGLRIIVNVNETAKTLDRIEVGGTKYEPIKDCTYNFKTHKDICKTTGTKTTRLLMGISLSADSGAPVELPTQATSINDLLKGLNGASQ